MSITTTVTKITPQYLRGRTKDQLIEIVELVLREGERLEESLRDLIRRNELAMSHKNDATTAYIVGIIDEAVCDAKAALPK